MNVLYYDILQVGNEPLYVLVSAKGWVAISSFNELKQDFLASYTEYDCRLSREQVAPYAQELEEYFNGGRQIFTMSVDLLGRGTVFQREVWQALCQIPYGQTTSYGAIAQMIGKPKAVQAVGTAIGYNPLRIVIPCHRVLRSDGGLGGYNGGVEMKRSLLAIEGVIC